MRLDETKDRAIQEYLDTSSNTVYWCNLKLTQEKGLQFYQTRSHAVVLYNTQPAVRKSGMHEISGGALPKSSLNSKIVTGCTQTEFAQRSTRPTMPRRKTILGPMKWIEELRGNLEQRRWLQNSWHTTFDIRTAEYKSQRQGQEFDRKLREPPAQGILPSGLKSDAEDQQVQQRIAGFDHRHEQHRDLRTLQKLFQTAMSWVQCLLEKGYQYFAVVEDA